MASEKKVASSRPTFHPFLRLPPELRHQIWREAIPDFPENLTVFFYGNLPEPSPGQEELPRVFDNDQEDEDVYFDVYIPAKIVFPQLFVNREARAATISWGLNNDRYARFCEKAQIFIWSRVFNRNFDILYIPYSKWNEYCQAPCHVKWRPDDEDCIRYSTVAHIAVPMAILLNHSNALFRTLLERIHPRTVSIVCDMPPDVYEETRVLISRCWEVQDITSTESRHQTKGNPLGGHSGWRLLRVEE